MKHYWVSSKKMTFDVWVNDAEVIIDIAPIGKRFRGQTLTDLKRWLARQGGLEVIEYEDTQLKGDR